MDVVDVLQEFIETIVQMFKGDHLFGKPGNVTEFDSCQGNVRDFIKSQGSVWDKILSGKSRLKLFIVSCIFASVHAGI